MGMETVGMEGRSVRDDDYDYDDDGDDDDEGP